jgi:hypothetical protein
VPEGLSGRRSFPWFPRLSALVSRQRCAEFVDESKSDAEARKAALSHFHGALRDLGVLGPEKIDEMVEFSCFFETFFRKKDHFEVEF